MRETKFCVNPLTGASKQIGEIAYNVFHHHHYKRCVVHSTQRPAAHLNDKSKKLTKNALRWGCSPIGLNYLYHSPIKVAQ